MDAYIRAVTFLSRVAGVARRLLIGLAVLVICDMVVERYILNLTTIWQIDFVTYSIVARDLHRQRLRADDARPRECRILPLHVGPRVRYWLALVTDVAGVGFLRRCCSCSARSIGTRPGSKNWHSDTVWRARLWIPYAAMPIGLGLLVLQYIAELFCLVTRARAAIRHQPSERESRRMSPQRRLYRPGRRRC